MPYYVGDKSKALSEDAKTILIPERDDTGLLFCLAHWGDAKSSRNCARSWTIFQALDDDHKTFRAVAAASRKNWILLRYFFCCLHTRLDIHIGRVSIFAGLRTEAGTQPWHPSQVTSSLCPRGNDQCRCGSITARHVICGDCIQVRAEQEAFNEDEVEHYQRSQESD